MTRWGRTHGRCGADITRDLLTRKDKLRIKHLGLLPHLTGRGKDVDEGNGESVCPRGVLKGQGKQPTAVNTTAFTLAV